MNKVLQFPQNERSRALDLVNKYGNETDVPAKQALQLEAMVFAGMLEDENITTTELVEQSNEIQKRLRNYIAYVAATKIRSKENE